MKRSLTIVFLIGLFFTLIWAAARAADPPPGDVPEAATPEPEPETEVIRAIDEAINGVIDEREAYTMFFWRRTIRIEDTTLSGDRQWATASLVPYNDLNDQIPEGEPALVISQLVAGEWQVWMPNDPGYLDAIASTPDDLLPPEIKQVYLEMNTIAAVAIPNTALGGYLLPWDAGISYYLTGSTCHDSYIPSGNAHYSFDFAYNRTMWDILAVKDGIVWVWDDTVPTCYEPSCWQTQPVGNYLVIKDESTEPDTYHLYLHLKQDSIPADLKKRGTPVKQGQFIAIVDNTGQSSGSHLHFQVQVPYLGEDHYWGRSVDVTFDDVGADGLGGNDTAVRARKI